MRKRILQAIKKDRKYLLFVVLLGVLAAAPLLRPGYFNMHDDLQMMRQLAMEECFRDGQIPCRWTQHMGYGFGFPLFNFYPPLPYLVGQGIRLLGFSFVNTVKYTFFLSFIFSGLAMYLFAREFFKKIGALLASAFYIWAPYHAVDVYVRGAMNEAWSFVFFPLILWSSYRLIRQAQFRYIVILALSWFALFTSHNLMVLIFTPLFAAWAILWLMRARSWFTVPQLVISGLWGFGLAAFFTLPVLLEKNLVHVETLVQGYYEYIAHFATLPQLLTSRFWGYGPSAWAEDFMSFQVGHLYWMLSIVIVGMVLGKILKVRTKMRHLTRKDADLILVVLFFFAAGWFAAFMAHNRSTPIWLAIEPLKFVQFPWRFVTLSTLSFSVVAGGLVALSSKKRLNSLLAGLLIIAVVLWNKDYFKPEFMGPLTDEEKFSGAAWELQQTAGIFDYLPKSARLNPKGPQEVLAEIVEGEGEVSEMEQGSNWAKFRVRVSDPTSPEASSGQGSVSVRINIFQFPEWKVFIDGQEVEITTNDDELGRMHIRVPQGEHEVTVRLYNTPVRTAGNLISLFSWLALFTAPIWRRR